MDPILSFIFTSFLLGVGLAMDAFSVSLANGLAEPKMKFGRALGISGIFAAFQFLMPLVGWFCVHALAEAFVEFQKFIPYIALILLCFIGGKMLYEGIKKKQDDAEILPVGIAALMVQGIATSIDALSVGFTITDYNFPKALGACAIIGVLTFFICIAGVLIGKRFGTAISGKATIAGGIILIIIGIEIFITGIVA